MKIYDIIKKYLDEEPRARERRNKDRAIVNLLLKKYPSLREVSKDTLIELCHDFNSYDRQWRNVTMREIELRGNDYYQKALLEKRKKAELGY